MRPKARPVPGRTGSIGVFIGFAAAEELRLKLGQRLGIGFEGYEIPEDCAKLIREYKIGSVILFRRNAKSKEQLKKLCGDLHRLIKEETGLTPYIMIDEECGSVSRLSHIAAMTPSAMAIGATDDPENARVIARLIGDELREMGINFNLAPVLDCFTNPDNTVDGNRMFAASPEKVARFGLAYIRGLHESGIIACGKHFPGHGDTSVDSHLALPIINKTMEEIRRTELVPFKAAIDAGIDSIMSAHIIFTGIEPDAPATVSRKVMTNLYGIPNGTLRALNAGVDIALICNSLEETAHTARYLEEAYADGRLTDDELLEHDSRILRFKSKLPDASGSGEHSPTPEQLAEPARIMEESITILNAPAGEAWPVPDRNTVVFGTRARRNALVNDDIELNAAKAFSDAFGCVYAEDAPQNAPEKAIVFIGRHPETHKTVEAAKRLIGQGTKLIAVSLFTPGFLDPLPDSVWKVGAWQYDDLSISALVRFCRRYGKE